MARLIAAPKLVIGALALVVGVAIIFLVTSILAGNSDRASNYSQPLPPGSVPLATVPTQDRCQTVRSFDCFLFFMNETELIPQNHLSSSYNLTQKAGDYSVHLRRGYADGKRIAIAVEIDSPEKYNFMAIWVRLTDENGREFASSSYGSSPYTNGQTGMIFSYDSGDLSSDVKAVRVKLEIPAIVPWSAPDASAPVTPTPGPTPVPPPDQIYGPFVFNLNLPVIPIQTIEPKQMLKTADFGEVTLEKVIVTPVEIEAFIRGVPNNTTFEASVNGWTSADLPGGAWRSTGKQPDGTTEIVISTSPPGDKRAGQWTLAFRQSALIQVGLDTQPDTTIEPGYTATAAPPDTSQGTRTAPPVATPVQGKELTPFAPPGPFPIFATFQFNLS